MPGVMPQRRLLVVAALGLAGLLAACTPGSSGVTGPGDGDGASAAASTRPAGVDDPTWKVSNDEFRGSDGIEGYADQVSVLPGQPVRLFISSPSAGYSVTAYRMTGTAKSGALRVWKSGKLAGERQTKTTTEKSTRSTSADWQPSVTVSTEGWSPGVYLFRLAGTDGSASFVPLVVRSESTAGTVVLAMSALTWQAYNTWGGASSYNDEEGSGFSSRSYAVSFDRPYANGKGTGKYLSYENAVVLRAEKLGIPLSYVTTLDVATIPGLLDGALGYVSLGHDEYWTASQRDAVEAARDAGTNLAFLGANVSYWQVRLRQDGRVIDIYKSGAKDPVDGKGSTVRFRDLGRPERLVTGQMYECYPAEGEYTVLDPTFFLFDGTGAERGTTYSGLVEVEVDRAYPVKGTPSTLQVVALSDTTCDEATTVSTSSYYTVESGAGVFSTGTMGWVLKAMGSQASPRTFAFVTKVTSNLLRAMAAGPLGAAHPSEPNLATLDLPTTNTTGAA